MLAEQREVRRWNEDAAHELLATARRLPEASKLSQDALVAAFGLTDGVRRMIVADALQIAAAELVFDSSLRAREAIDAVIAEVEALREGAGGEG